MGDFILQTEPVDLHHHKQSTKVSYLQQENRQLNEHIADLEQMIRLNKDALRVSVSTQYSKDQSIPGVKNYYLILEKLQQENMKLHGIIEKLRKDRDLAQSKVNSYVMMIGDKVLGTYFRANLWGGSAAWNPSNGWARGENQWVEEDFAR